MENYWAFVLFVAVMTGTPGPGNLSMLVLGQTVGYRRALPFFFGMVAGGVLLDILVAVGLGELYAASPNTATVFKVASVGYILYLAWRVLRMQAAASGESRPFRFWEGLMLHPLNPKTWAMAVSSFSQFVDPAGPRWVQSVLFVLTFLGGMLVFHSLWCLAGESLLRWMQAPARRWGVNAVMVLLMVGATMYALFV